MLHLTSIILETKNYRRASAALLAALITAGLATTASAQTATTYIWNNSNAGATPTQTLDWFTGGTNTAGLWSGNPVSGNTNTIQFFQDTNTALGYTGVATQTANINNGGNAFELKTLTLGGKASTNNGVAGSMLMTISGDALNFSSATGGTINLTSTANYTPTRTLNYDVGSNIIIGTSTQTSALTIAGSGQGTYTFSGIISALKSDSSLTKTGTSTAILTKANTYTGKTTISQGTLQLGNGQGTGKLDITGVIESNGTFAINRNNVVAQGSDFSGAAITGTGGLSQIGTGTTTLNTANSYSGLTLVSAGTLVLNGSNTSKTGGTQVGNGSGGTLILGTEANGGLAGGTITFNNGTIQSSDANSRSISNVIAFGTVKNFASGGTGGLAFTNNGPVTLTALTTFIINANTSFAQSFTGSNIGITKNGTAILTLSGVNTFTGVTTVSAGTLATDATGTFGQGNISIGLTTAATLTFGNGNSIADTATFTIGKYATINLGAFSETVGGLTSLTGIALANGTYTVNNSDSAFNLSTLFGGAKFNGTGSLIVSSIPEPATYAALVGLGILGFAVNRRRKTS